MPYDQLIVNICATIVMVFMLIGSLFVLVLTVTYYFRCTDYENDYLDTLSDDERKVIMNFKTKGHLRIRDTFKRIK